MTVPSGQTVQVSDRPVAVWWPPARSGVAGGRRRRLREPRVDRGELPGSRWSSGVDPQRLAGLRGLEDLVVAEVEGDVVDGGGVGGVAGADHEAREPGRGSEVRGG
ncbi:hypothetical protein [Pseudonocardia thermophila]|uniref:hypothetical protein n=1 Tax=Pseudonocardia thermophila TaxID=1848 RepID=UPI00116154A2|nr:hypothetical protein [Pseudonocardia thermophila]